MSFGIHTRAINSENISQVLHSRTSTCLDQILSLLSAPTRVLVTMYDPYTDYFGLSQLLHNCQREDDCRSTTTTSHLNMLKDDFNSNGTVSDFNNNMVSPNSNTALQSSPTSSPAPVNGFLPLPLQISDITELSKVMRGAGRRRVLSGNGRPQIVSWCVFCKNNGESEMVYASHKLKSEEGLTTCPILRAYTCPLCGTNGDHAHTIKYCPLNKLKEGGEIGGVSTGPGTIGSQYRTPRTSTGRRRTSSISLSSGGTL